MPLLSLTLRLPLARCAWVVGLAVASFAAHSQSLQALYEAARAYDATYLAARSQAESAQYRRDQAYALRRPSVGLTAGASRVGTDLPRVGENGYATQLEAAVSARQPLYNRSNSATIDQAERGYDVAMADLENAEQDLIVRLTQAYFDVLSAQDTLGTARANKTAIAEQLASAKRNFEVGTATITDTREAQARFDLATAQEIAADNDLRTKRIALDLLVGRSNVTPQPLAVPVQMPQLAPTNVDDWVQFASVSPNVRKAQLAYDVAKLETEKARAGHLPTVDLVGSYGKQNNDSLVGAPAGTLFIPGTTTQASIGVQMNLPLYAGHSVQNRIKETLALEEKSRNDLDAARRIVTQSTRQAFLGVQSGEASVRALEAAEASSKLALEATQLGYKVGVRVNLDVLNAQTQLYTTQRDLARARYDLILTNLRLRQAAGTLKPEDVSSVNRLLTP
ncbi:TolC family outer membrane protein [Caldimonas sp. KR1-144]|uniref:TolC family outer membrane protein n=1 Tax=Caldimonas sp. KR1-144 TaxID=3400911 RepID=UPI003BFD397E